jgi:hypothetical protein
LAKREIILCTEKSRQYFNSIPVIALKKSRLAVKKNSIKNGEGIVHKTNFYGKPHKTHLLERWDISGQCSWA